MKLIITNGQWPDKKEQEMVISPLLSHHMFNIDEYVADSEMELIEIYNTNSIPLSMLSTVLSNYVRKLRKGGKITIHGRDLYKTVLAITNRNLDLGQANAALYGGPEVHNLLSSLVGIEDIASFVQSTGLKILSKQFNDLDYILEAERVN